MRTPKGFGKCYFTLTAILAHAVAPKLHAERTRCTFAHTYSYDETKEEAEEDPPPETLLLTAFPSTQKSRPCHCNCYFRARTLLLLKLVRTLPKCNCNCRFFSFRRTGTHPPKPSFF